jgi:hypothetical protein
MLRYPEKWENVRLKKELGKTNNTREVRVVLERTVSVIIALCDHNYVRVCVCVFVCQSLALLSQSLSLSPSFPLVSYVLTRLILYSTVLNVCVTFINIQKFCVFLTHDCIFTPVLHITVYSVMSLLPHRRTVYQAWIGYGGPSNTNIFKYTTGSSKKMDGI